MTGTGTWRNWGRTYSCRPHAVESPSTEAEIQEAVVRAGAAGRRVKVAGSGHSFTDIACTDGLMLTLARHNRVLRVDTAAATATVEAGIALSRLSDELARHGLALPNMGDIGYQSVAGAISTATHGTGARFGNLATQVTAIRLVTADGATVDCSASWEPETFRAAQVSLGALGVISAVTLQCERAFNLHAIEQPRRLDDVVEALDDLVDANEHFEFFWFPHTEWTITKANNRTDRPAPASKRWLALLDDVLLENGVFGLACWLGRVRPPWTPGLSRVLARGLRRSEAVQRSDRVFTSPRLVRFAEMEYAIPRQAAREALARLRQLIDSSGLRVSFPVEVRFVAPDGIFLSPGTGRETCYIAVHMFRGLAYEPYFRGVEEIMTSCGGRPHWGKLHFQTAETLAPRYPDWDRFQKVRGMLDRRGIFANAYLDRVLGLRE